MNHFFMDASALGKRYVVEVGTPLINHLFDTVPATRMIALIITLGEIISILVRRRNAGDISQRAFQQTMIEFRAEVIDAPDFSLQAVSNDLVRASHRRFRGKISSELRPQAPGRAILRLPKSGLRAHCTGCNSWP